MGACVGRECRDGAAESGQGCSSADTVGDGGELRRASSVGSGGNGAEAASDGAAPDGGRVAADAGGRRFETTGRPTLLMPGAGAKAAVAQG